MSFRSLHFMNQRATVLRPNFAVDVTTIRDRILTGYGTVKADVPVYLEPQGSDVVFHEQLGHTGVDTYAAFLPGGTGVQVNDVLLVEGVYYEVHGVLDFQRQGFHVRADVVRKNFQRS